MTVEAPTAPAHGAARKWSAEIALAFVCLIWGSTFVVVKNALADISTVLFLALRFSFATIFLAILYFARGGRLEHGGARAGLLTGVLLYAGYLLQTLGLRHTTPATSGFIIGLYIVLVPMVGAAIYRRIPGVFEWLGFALAAFGMALMTLRTSELSLGAGEMLTLWCAVAFAGHILALGHFSQRMHTDWLSLLQIASCAAIALATFWWVEEPVLRLSPAVLLAIGVTSLFATALAFWIQTWAQARTTTTRAAIIFSLEPVFAWLASWLLEGEVLTARALSGALLILGGILLVELKPARAR